MKYSSSRNRWLRQLQIGLLGAVVFILIGVGKVDWQRAPFLLTGLPLAQAQPAQLRRIDPSAIAARVYEQIPTLPLENQYISSKNGQVAEDNTLVSRIIRYHLYSKERPTSFRFDWKLTLADYLGAFDRISATNYADYGLSENPIEADVAVIQSLSQQARDQLVNALYTAFVTPVEAVSSAPSAR